jgi:tetratricopeptide (TPR) repeat protein
VASIKDLSTRDIFRRGRRATAGAVLIVSTTLLFGCGDIFTHDVPRLGTAGHYTEARQQFLKGTGGNMEKAIADLSDIVREDPTYKDSLTLLGRAYYNQGTYETSRQMLQRALRVNKEDEVAWLTLGMAQLRLGEDQKGIETLQGAITLVSKVSKPGYRGYAEWDSKGIVRSYISRSVVEIRKGLDAKPSLLRTCEALLLRMDDEEHFQKMAVPQTRRQDYQR